MLVHLAHHTAIGIAFDWIFILISVQRDVTAPTPPTERSQGRAPCGGVAGWSKAASERAHRVRCSEEAALRRSPAISGLGSGCEDQL